MATRAVSNKQRLKMRSMRLKGISLRDISAETERSWSCVRKHVLDIPVRCKSGPKGIGRSAKLRMLVAFEANVPRREIASRFGISPSSVGPMLCAIRKMKQGEG